MDPSFLKHLTDLSGADPNARQQAEEVQKQQFSQNIAPYLKNLSLALVTDSVPESVRLLAGIIIKNALQGTSENNRRAHQQVWLNIPSPQRSEIKSALLSGLGSSSNPARKGSCAAVASIAIAELPVGEWQDLIPTLTNAAKQNNPIVQDGSLVTIGLICEDIDPVPAILESQAGEILTAIAFCAHATQVEVRRASIKAMCGALGVVGNVFCGQSKAPRDHIMTIICNACKDSDQVIQSNALLSLVKTAELYYDYLDQDYMVAIWEITSIIMPTDSEAAPLTIEFWSTIAEMERDKHENEDDYGGDSTCANFSSKILPMLVPKLCENLLKQVDDTADEDEWNIASAAAACITVLAECTQNEIVPVIRPFIEKIKNENWRQREASTMAFGSILAYYDSEEKSHMIVNVIGILMEHLASDPHDCVRSTSAWALSRIAIAAPEIIVRDTLTVLRSLVGGLANQDAVIAYYSCFGLLNILNIYYGKQDETHNDLSDIFAPLFSELIKAGDREDAGSSNLRITCYEAINALIEVAPLDCIEKTKDMINPFLAKLDNSFSLNVDLEDQRQLQAYIPLVLQTITKRVKGEIGPYAPAMYKKFIQIFETRQTIVDESMNAIATLFEEYPAIIEHCINSFTHYFLSALQNFQDTSVLKSGLICLGAMCDSLGPNLYRIENGNFCNTILENLIKHLQNPDVDQDLRPLIIISFADIALAIGPHFQIYFLHIMNVLCAAADTPIPPDGCNEDFIDYVIALREAILEACPPVIDAMVEADKQREFVPFLGKIIPFMELLWNENDYRTRNIVSSMIGLLGDILKNIVPCMEKAQAQQILQVPFISAMLEHGLKHQNPDTKSTAAWAKQQLNAVRSM